MQEGGLGAAGSPSFADVQEGDRHLLLWGRGEFSVLRWDAGDLTSSCGYIQLETHRLSLALQTQQDSQSTMWV